MKSPKFVRDQNVITTSEGNCKKCSPKINSFGKGLSRFQSKGLPGYFIAIIIAILPKCPMCALAYSTAITMCSGKVFDHRPDWTSYISILLAIATLALVLWNYKGSRTIVASALILAGGVIIFNSELFTGNTTHYYVGCMLVLSGVWSNGSLLHFVRKWFRLDRSRNALRAEVNGTD